MESKSVSIVIPIYNEEENLKELYQRLNKTLTKLNIDYRIIMTDDGSRDNSLEILKQIQEKDPHVTVIEFNRNYGQHAAVFAALKEATGDIVITIDADLQNPPEEIPLLIEKINEGYEVVGTIRKNRKDSPFRKLASSTYNFLLSKATGIKIKDRGCMLRAYKRSIVDSICQCQEISSFIPALANSFAKSIADIEVEHDERKSGTSKYNLFKLIRLNFDLMTGFSSIPIQLVSASGVVISFLGVAFGIFLFIRRLLVGPEVEGVFTLFAILFVFIGVQVLSLGLIGEYIARIYSEVRKRPRYVIKQTYKAN